MAIIVLALIWTLVTIRGPNTELLDDPRIKLKPAVYRGGADDPF